MIGTLYVSSRCVISESEKKYWDIKSYGACATSANIKKRERAEIWQSYVRKRIGDILAKKSPRTGAEIAEIIKNDKNPPVWLPSYDVLLRFVCKELKARGTASKRKAIRLVHG
jgi:hypothetical protein